MIVRSITTTRIQDRKELRKKKLKSKNGLKSILTKKLLEVGDAPTEYEINNAVEERFPKNYNLSLEYDFGSDESDTDLDKNRLLYQLAVNTNYENSDDT